MGSSQTKNKSKASEKVVEGLKEKVRVVQAEISEIMRVREAENQVYERELMVFAFKQAEWKRERKGLKEEVKKLRKIVEEERERVVRGTDDEREWGYTSSIVDKQARRDETVEKWKQLYFAIKVELDHLIQTTHQEERWKTMEEDVLEEVRKDLISKEQKIELLEAKLASVKIQEFKREREMDILRQSLRIMCHKKRSNELGKRSIDL
ncbi:hypothetical protein ACS0TY_022979 [Phlomoides rotata]